ncbi:protein of unknown function (DUF1816) [Rubidibacter lacunae KORDI 51-2]|uniref:DUF1816 domain-containing protein n=1 Tax=Rubidibacter lacunae KORDI 51-2 TaxID=582515 RepID=U5D645_9CHRO|nr:DUF1816 domain-containing protein [Rubidibacter lacunae]ERN40098.1 protein of unknown function (DUF1816) [Rubidibacter lacunae KORDI 51-2]
MMKLLVNILDSLGAAWWVRIKTENPQCTYCFGPFANKREAEASQDGYIEDLESEGATIAALIVERCKPEDLTVYGEDGEQSALEKIPTLSGQAS